MRVLFLAPHPFYQNRGTPLAVNQLLKVLSERQERIDVITYHEGLDVTYRHVSIYRIPAIPFVKNIRPGFSWKKLVCDLLMVILVLKKVRQNRYDVVHAVEESVFIALLAKRVFGIPYVYDMDSSLAEQLVEKYPYLEPLSGIFHFFERMAIKHAKAVVPVCEELLKSISDIAQTIRLVLQDVSLLQECRGRDGVDLGIHRRGNEVTIMYVGNLEEYQGIDLLLESFAIAVNHYPATRLVLVGGADEDIAKYQKKTREFGVQEKVWFVGPKPIEDLSMFLARADVLVSPRIKGKNTPMKIYSYLDSCKAILATDLPTHSQILDKETAFLAPPNPQAFAHGMVTLCENESLRLRLGTSGKELFERRFSRGAFREKVNYLYDQLQKV